MRKHHITIKNKKYIYTIKSIDKETVSVVVPAAGIDQKFLKADLGEFLEDLPQWIIDRQREQKESVLRFRVDSKEKKQIEKRAYKEGCKSVSEYLRKRALGV